MELLLDLLLELLLPAAGPAPKEPGASTDGSGGGPVQLPAAKPGKGTAPVTVLLGVQPAGAATPMMDDMLCICASPSIKSDLTASSLPRIAYPQSKHTNHDFSLCITLAWSQNPECQASAHDRPR